jgi:colicin import membrane protein
MTSFLDVAKGEVAQLKRRESEIAARSHDLSRAPTDVSDLADIHQRFDAAYSAIGTSGSPSPLPNESRFSYRRRLAAGLQRFSDDWRQADLYRLNNDAMKAAETAIIADTFATVGDHAIGNADGSLREIKTTDISGREVTEWAGNPRVWLSAYAGTGKTVKKFRNPVTGQTLRPSRRSI